VVWCTNVDLKAHLNNPWGTFSVYSHYIPFHGKNGEHSMYVLWTLLIIMVLLLAFHEFLPGSLNKLPDYSWAKIVRDIGNRFLTTISSAADTLLLHARE